MRSIGLRLPKDIDEHLAKVEQRNLSRVIIEALRAHWLSNKEDLKPIVLPTSELSDEDFRHINRPSIDLIPFAEDFSCSIGSIPAK